MTKPTLRNYIGLFLSAVVLLVSGCATPCKTTSMIGPRPSEWAIQMRPTPDVPNFYKINDDISKIIIYRSAQPNKCGMLQLWNIGIKTIIDLREFHSDISKIASTGLHIERVPMNAEEVKKENEEVINKKVIKVMRILSHQENGPFLIHCQHGSDRTGLMCAMYRILKQGWTQEEAIDEMANGGYGFHLMYINIINYILGLQPKDIENLQKEIQAK